MGSELPRRAPLRLLIAVVVERLFEVQTLSGVLHVPRLQLLHEGVRGGGLRTRRRAGRQEARVRAVKAEASDLFAAPLHVAVVLRRLPPAAVLLLRTARRLLRTPGSVPQDCRVRDCGRVALRSLRGGSGGGGAVARCYHCVPWGAWSLRSLRPGSGSSCRFIQRPAAAAAAAAATAAHAGPQRARGWRVPHHCGAARVAPSCAALGSGYGALDLHHLSVHGVVGALEYGVGGFFRLEHYEPEASGLVRLAVEHNLRGLDWPELFEIRLEGCVARLVV